MTKSTKDELTPKNIKYEGAELQNFQKGIKHIPKDFSKNFNEGIKEFKENIAPYFPGDGLKAAVEYARILNRPLLLRGEPGCGKTRLAQALAFELYKEIYRTHYFEWHIKSTTKAIDGLYDFDHLRRLRDIQAGDREKEGTDFKYRSFGPLGKAFIASKKNNPSVLLIDEIDKADIDFPNDLLLELDQKRFFIQETEEEIVAEEPPIIIITSNDEKELPNAFLRRCVYHYIEFPSNERLTDIIRAKIKEQYEGEFKDMEGTKMLEEVTMDSIVKEFRKVYDIMDGHPSADKKPSTSELLDWVRIIHLKYIQGELTLENDELSSKKLLYPEVLLKSIDDQKYVKDKW